MPVVHHDDVAVGDPPGQPLGQRLRVRAAVPVEVPQAPAPSDEHVIDLRQPLVHVPAARAAVGPERAARAPAGQALDALGGGGQHPRDLVGRQDHRPPGMRVQAHGVALVEHPADDRRRSLVEVAIDHEEGRRRLLPAQDVEQIRRRGRVRAVIERKIDGRGAAARGHAPQRVGGGHGVQHEREGRDVRQRQQPEARGDEQEEHRLNGIPGTAPA